MRELVRLIEEPRSCSYLPNETAALEYRIVQDLRAEEYERLLARGYRRFGRQLFRPECPRCQQCVSIRILAQSFEPSSGQRRILRKNRFVRAERQRVSVSDEHVQLYNRYQRFMAQHRGWRPDRIMRADYFESFVSGGGDFAWQWQYYDRESLIGVALMDETPQAVSLVYFYHEPDWRPLSPGVLSILTQLDYARSQGKRFVFPGYWIAANQSMAYKSKFRPFERLVRQPNESESPEWALEKEREVAVETVVW